MESFSFKWEEWIVLLKQNRSERHCWLQKMNTFRFPRIPHLIQELGRTAELWLNQADSSDAGTTGGHATRNRDLPPPPPGAHRTTKCSLLLLRQPCWVQSFYAGILLHVDTRQISCSTASTGRICHSLALLSHKNQILSSTLMLFVTSLDFYLMPLSLI